MGVGRRIRSDAMSEPTKQQTLSDPWPAPRPDGPVRTTVTLPGLEVADQPRAGARRPVRRSQRRTPCPALARHRADGRGPDHARLRGRHAGEDWTVTPGTLQGRGAVDCGLAGTVMRFVPPVAALADGAGRLRRRPARPRPARCTRCSRRCAASASTSTTRTAARCRSPSSATARSRGGTVTIDASASSQFVSALLLAGARYDEGVDVRHDGKPVPSLPHIDMTVAQLRDCTASRSTTPTPTAGGSPPARSARSTCWSSPTCPTPRRSWPPRWSPAARSRSATGRARPPRPATRCATILGADGREGRARPTRASP